MHFANFVLMALAGQVRGQQVPLPPNFAAVADGPLHRSGDADRAAPVLEEAGLVAEPVAADVEGGSPGCGAARGPISISKTRWPTLPSSAAGRRAPTRRSTASPLGLA